MNAAFRGRPRATPISSAWIGSHSADCTTGFARESRSHARKRFTLPGMDQRLMHAVFRQQLGDRRLGPDGLKRQLRLEFGALVLPFASNAVCPRQC